MTSISDESMTRREVCGKRIWSDPVLKPDKRAYHYECAKEIGVLPSLETAKSEIERLVIEIHSHTTTLDKMRTDGSARKDSASQLQVLSEKVRYLDSLQKVLVKRRKEMSERKGGA